MRQPDLSAPAAPITLVIARFDDLLARGLRALVEEDPGIAILAADIEQSRISTVLRAHRPSVAMLDAGSLPKPSAIRELSIAHPATRLVLLADELPAVECAQLLAFGASACLKRSTQARDVLSAIHLAARGLQLTPRSSGRQGEAPLAGSHLLTRREAEVLPLLRQGRSNAQIALALQVGVETVRTHARNIYRKLGITSREELATPPAGVGDLPARAEQRPTPHRGAAHGGLRRRGHEMRRT